MGVKWKLTDRPFTTTTPGRSMDSQKLGTRRQSANVRGDSQCAGAADDSGIGRTVGEYRGMQAVDIERWKRWKVPRRR